MTSYVAIVLGFEDKAMYTRIYFACTHLLASLIYIIQPLSVFVSSSIYFFSHEWRGYDYYYYRP